MLTDNKKIWIYWKNIDSSYAYANRKVLVEPPRKIGSSISSVNKILSNTEEQKNLMADIISISPNSPNWNELLKYYWDSISEEIPESGRKLEVGFTYDIDAQDKANYIKSINSNITSDKAKIKSDNDLKSYIDNRLDKIINSFNLMIKDANKLTNDKARDTAISEAYKFKHTSIIKVESERYKVGTPINAVDYMLYRYCLVYRDVANEFTLVNKSPNIRFYLHSEADIKRYKELKRKSENSRMSAYLDIIKNVSKVENVLYAMGFADEIPEDDIDKYTFLDEKSKENSNKFIRVATNKNLEQLGLIEKYIKFNIINRLPGSQVIVDSTDPTKVIGNTINEVVSWFNNDKNAATVSEYALKFKNLPK